MTEQVSVTDEDRDVLLPRELFNFLMGTGEIDGTSFGEMNNGLPGPFWWRALLRAAEQRTPTGEPVAWMYAALGNVLYSEKRNDLLAANCLPDGEWTETPLYTHPAPTLPDEGMVEAVKKAMCKADGDCDDCSTVCTAAFDDYCEAILPLIASAREQGARDMRERAAKKLEREWPGPAAKIVRSLDVSRGEG